MSGGHKFVVERYMPRLKAADVQVLAGRLAEAARELRAEGRQVSWLRSLALPDDETCLCTFSAPTLGDVKEANRRAGAGYERILVAIEIVGVSMTRCSPTRHTIGDAKSDRRENT